MNAVVKKKLTKRSSMKQKIRVSAKEISRQNVWNVDCLLLMAYDKIQDMRHELLGFQAELEEIQRNQDFWIGI